MKDRPGIPRPMRPRSGIALLLVLGILGLMAVASVAFTTLTQMERRASLGRIHASKATLLARSGLEDAVARLSAGQTATYEGEDWDNSNTLNGLEAASERFKPGILDRETCPVREALRPSFFVRDPASLDAHAMPAPRLMSFASAQRGLSGVLGGESYTLKVEDESAKINVNGGFLDAMDRDADGIPDHRDSNVRPDPADPKDTGLGWNAQLERILNVLGARPEIGIPGLGAGALGNRPLRGWRSIPHLQQALGTAKDLSPYLTTSSWVDDKVVHPNAYPTQPSDLAPSTVVATRRPLRREEGGRPPVNLNAAPLPVLASLVEGLAGISWFDTTSPALFSLNATQATQVATALQAARPFSSWNAFSQWCDGLVPAVLKGPNPAWSAARNLCRADLLKSNFDPNTRLGKLLPDQVMHRFIDKSDLTVWSTEGSLAPTGTMRLEATGRLCDPSGKILAERSLAMLVEAYRLLRHTSQKDFVGGRSPDQYLSLSTDLLDPVHGTAASWKTWGGAAPSVATYPCPATALPAHAADYDGAIALATYELDAASPPHPCLFLHHLDDSLDADVGNPTGRISHADNLLVETGITKGTWPAAGEPCALVPDGFHLQSQRGIAFQAQGNLPPTTFPGGQPANHGVISYWAKAPSIVNRTFFDCCCVRWDGNALTQFLGTGHGAIYEQWGIVFETFPTPSNADQDFERQWQVWDRDTFDALMPGLRWRLVTAFYDSDEDTVGEDVYCRVEGALPTAFSYPGVYGLPFNASRQDLLAPGVSLVLGGARYLMWGTVWAQANAVVDEFAICDFGTDGAATRIALDAWHAARFAIGRYYRWDDARFLSPVIAPSGGESVRILRASWTAILPRDNRQEVFNEDSFLNPGTKPVGQPRVLDPRLAASDVLVELTDDYGAMTGPALKPLAQGGLVGVTLPAFRYRVTFRPHPLDPATGAYDPANQPVLETPWFDDITFAWQAESGPRVLALDTP